MIPAVPPNLIATLRAANHIVFLTGAGVSAESGIPTFRDAMTGLWQRYSAEQLATADAFTRDRDLVWGWYEWRRMQVMKADPNAAHRAIAAFASKGPRVDVITQNVDDLHERAGSDRVLHLHGRLNRPFCFECRQPHALPLETPDEPDGGRRLAPPRCHRCNGFIRPGVVWFGEMLPEFEWQAAVEACEVCDVLFSVGTSSLVHPAAGLPLLAAKHLATIVQINPNPTSLDGIAQFNLVGAAGVIMPALLDAIW
ncbi:NAD-dependent deacylase [Paraburkholderia sp. SARCC-3016]|uniref:SIR2 family NAD-dependent protein deacylase n=1 Tax=Paraburkholderia sp. SARCC-3016 TaxID=3058611 RepID=UPI0028070CA0|nr:NAD-dependent deacylase [Paraburkholderia sp. SARCC-3016]MDQ7979296.1 NAD-dependent deacylase [Paraburkholderia sp. SARCC-3016]